MPTIAEALTSAFTKAEAGTLTEIPENNLAPDVQEPAESQIAAPEDRSPPPVEEKPGRTAGRPRDDKGRLLPGKAEQPTAPNEAPQQERPVPQQAAPKAARPSTWKKELEPHWGTLSPEVQAEILRREGDFAKGVSTYKTEFDRLKPYDEVVQKHLPVLQQHGLDPVQHIDSLLQAHQHLALGTPEQKLSTFARLAQNYGVPLQGLFVQGQDGQIYFNQQLLQQAQQPAQQRQPQQPDFKQIAREILIEERALTELQQFEQDAPQKHPHYEQVKATMQGLLQAGLADDMPSAYEAALRHPRHADLWEAIQQQERASEAERLAKERAQQAANARANAFSPRTATPTSTARSTGARSVEQAVREAVEEHASGRV